MSDDFVDYVMELFGPFGTIAVRRRFGACGVYLDGLMFALLSGDALYLKADEMNRVEFEQEGCGIYSYARKGARATLNFYRAPDAAMESSELMLPWARTAYAAALRASAKKQVASQIQAAKRNAQAEASAAPRQVTTAAPAKKPTAPSSRLAKATSKGTPRKKPTRPAQPVKRRERAR